MNNKEIHPERGGVGGQNLAGKAEKKKKRLVFGGGKDIVSHLLQMKQKTLQRKRRSE